MMGWAAVLGVALLGLLVYIAAAAAERLRTMAGELGALNAEIARTVALVDRAIAAQANAVAGTDVAASTAVLKAENDKLEPTLPPV